MKGKEELTIEQLFEKQNPQDGSCPKWAKGLAIEFAKLQVEAAQRWIPVDEEKPPLNMKVLLAKANGRLGSGFIFMEWGACGWMYENMKYRFEVITHWQPLPPAPTT